MKISSPIGSLFTSNFPNKQEQKGLCKKSSETRKRKLPCDILPTNEWKDGNLSHHEENEANCGESNWRDSTETDFQTSSSSCGELSESSNEELESSNSVLKRERRKWIKLRCDVEWRWRWLQLQMSNLHYQVEQCNKELKQLSNGSTFPDNTMEIQSLRLKSPSLQQDNEEESEKTQPRTAKSSDLEKTFEGLICPLSSSGFPIASCEKSNTSSSSSFSTETNPDATNSVVGYSSSNVNTDMNSAFNGVGSISNIQQIIPPFSVAGATPTNILLNGRGSPFVDQLEQRQRNHPLFSLDVARPFTMLSVPSSRGQRNRLSSYRNRQSSRIVRLSKVNNKRRYKKNRTRDFDISNMVLPFGF